MLHTLRWAAKTGREQNTGAARNLLEEAHLIGEPTLLTAPEALLNVLPLGVAASGGRKPDAGLSGAANDFEALERPPRRSRSGCRWNCRPRRTIMRSCEDTSACVCGYLGVRRVLR
jgi:hypothetical protein